MTKSKLLEQLPVKVWATLAAFTATIAMSILKPMLPKGEDYTSGFAPQWASSSAAILGVIVLLLAIGWPRVRIIPRQMLLVAAWVVSLLMVWSSAGIIFDGLRAAAVVGIPGLPPVVDWTGFASRIVCLVGAALLISTFVCFQRLSRGACIHCGRTQEKTIPVGNRAAYTALALSFPYPLLKLYWSLGGAYGGGKTFAHNAAYGELLLLIGSMLLSLALVRRWGRIFPDWMPFLGGRKVPRLLIITVGWIAAGLTIPMGVLAILGSIMQALGLSDGPVRFDDSGLIVLFVYGVWLLYGLSTVAAVWRYTQQTRCECRHCIKKTVGGSGNSTRLFN